MARIVEMCYDIIHSQNEVKFKSQCMYYLVTVNFQRANKQLLTYKYVGLFQGSSV